MIIDKIKKNPVLIIMVLYIIIMSSLFYYRETSESKECYAVSDAALVSVKCD